MKIRIEHKNIGAALMQIAEHPQFTAINSMIIKKVKIGNAFRINNNIGILCKYASEPNEGGEYLFNFLPENIDAIDKMVKHNDHVFIALVCVEDAEICCLTSDAFQRFIEQRKKSAKREEESYQILVTAEQGNSLRVYVNAYGKKGKTAGKKLIIARNAFPGQLFG